MSETSDNTDESNETNADENNTPMIDPDDLTDEQLEALSTHPEVRRMLEYQETQIPSIVPQMRNLRDDETETFDLFVEGVEDRTGRITETTIRKVFDAMIEEWEDVNA